MACALFFSIVSGCRDLSAGRHIINLVSSSGQEYPVADRALPIEVRRQLRLIAVPHEQLAFILPVADAGVTGSTVLSAKAAPPLAVRSARDSADPARLVHSLTSDAVCCPEQAEGQGLPPVPD